MAARNQISKKQFVDKAVSMGYKDELINKAWDIVKQGGANIEFCEEELSLNLINNGLMEYIEHIDRIKSENLHITSPKIKFDFLYGKACATIMDIERQVHESQMNVIKKGGRVSNKSEKFLEQLNDIETFISYASLLKGREYYYKLKESYYEKEINKREQEKLLMVAEIERLKSLLFEAKSERL